MTPGLSLYPSIIDRMNAPSLLDRVISRYVNEHSNGTTTDCHVAELPKKRRACKHVAVSEAVSSLFSRPFTAFRTLPRTTLIFWGGKTARSLRGREQTYSVDDNVGESLHVSPYRQPYLVCEINTGREYSWQRSEQNRAGGGQNGNVNSHGMHRLLH